VALKQGSHDLIKQQFNTVASGCMKILNALEKIQKESEQDWQTVAHEGLSILLRMLSPIAPHIAQTLWKELGYGEDILKATWPEPVESALVQDEFELAVQVNGKLRGTIMVGSTSSKEAIEQFALAQHFVQKFLEDGASVRKIIVVPNKLVNVVVG
jgi:leucyl-tRNA synthetase